MGDISYRPLIEEMTWSYSRISSFEACPYAWFMKYILEEEERPTFYASYGKFIHSLIERCCRGDLTREELPTAFLLGFSSEVQGERPNSEIVRKYISLGTEYFRSFDGFPYAMKGVEEELFFDAGGLHFHAFLDFVGERDGKLIVLDHKSRDLKPRSNRKKPTVKDQELDDMLRQLYLYAYGVKQKYGEFPSLLCFNCFKNRQLIEEPFSETACAEALDWAKRTTEEIADEEDFRPYMDFFHCKYLCGFHDSCCYWNGGDAS